jgi:hypothetical protein
LLDPGHRGSLPRLTIGGWRCRPHRQTWHAKAAHGGVVPALSLTYVCGPQGRTSAVVTGVGVGSVLARLFGVAASGHRALGESEHVGSQSMLGAPAALVGGKNGVRVDLSLEASKEGLAGRPGARATVGSAAPGDLGGNLLVDVFHCAVLTSADLFECGRLLSSSLWVAMAVQCTVQMSAMNADARKACRCTRSVTLTQRHRPVCRRSRARCRARSGRLVPRPLARADGSTPIGGSCRLRR